MVSIPSFSLLHAAIGQTWQIFGAEGHGLPVTVAGVHAGRPLTPQHECYALELQLPDQQLVGQGTYRLQAADGRSWILMMTPIIQRPGQPATLEAVFHYERSALTDI